MTGTETTPAVVFGSHIPSVTRAKGAQSPMAIFARGLALSPGTQWKFRFPNGRGASVINDGYGRDEGLYELAVLDDEERIDYTTPLTDDVLGYLSLVDVVNALDTIAALPAVTR